MNDLLCKLVKCFGENEDFFNTPNFSERNRVINAKLKCKKHQISQYLQIIDIIDEFPNRDILRIEIINEIDDSFKITSTEKNNETVKIAAFNDYLSDLNETEEIRIDIEIQKKIIDNKMSIYKFNNFNGYLLSLSIAEILKLIEYNLGENNCLIYELFDSDCLIATKSMIFKPVNNTYINTELDRKEKILNCKKASNFFCSFNSSLLPDDFYFIVNCLENPYKNIFDKIKSLLSIIYIANSSELNENILKVQISGQRTENYKYYIDKDIYSNDNLYYIYNWIYTDGNAIDKAMLARNIISLHCKYTNFIETDEKTIISIKSNYELYLKENVDKYIEIKNKMTEFLSLLIDQSKDIVLDIMGSLEKNIFAFFTFLITVFITNIISEKGLSNIFTKDITYLSYLILIGSLVFICIKNNQVKYKVKKFKDNYQAIKDNNLLFKESKEFSDVFDDTKIDAVEKEVNTEKWKVYKYWIMIIIFIFISIELLSDYSVIKVLIGLIKSKFH